MSKKLVTVFCATGKQGGGAVRHLLQDSSFSVRAVTRDPDSDSAKALSALGAQVVKANLNDRETVFEAVKGSYGVVGVTDFWTANGTEETQGKNIVDAAKAAGVKHFVWSTLDHSELKVPHWETKANVDDYLKESGVPRTSIYTAAFLEALGTWFFAPIRDSNGTLLLDVPYATDGAIPFIAGSDVGVLAGIVLQNPEKYIGKDIHAATSVSSVRKVAALMEEIVGEKVNVKEMSMEEFDKSKSTANTEIWLNMKWFSLYYAIRDIPGTLAILPKAKTARGIIEEKGGKAALLPQAK